MDLDKQLKELQSRLSFQEDGMDELSDSLADQQQHIQQLENSIQELINYIQSKIVDQDADS